MVTKESLLKEVETVCKVTGSKFDEISSELLEFIGEYEVIDYYIAVGSTPEYPDLVLDIMLLTNDCICDFDVRKNGIKLHIQPLKSIIEITESYVGDKEDYISTAFTISGTGGGVELQVKRNEARNVRRFSRSVRSQMFKK